MNANMRIFLAIVFVAQAAVALFGASNFLIVGLLHAALSINTAASLVERTGDRLKIVSLMYAALLQIIGAIVVIFWVCTAVLFWLTDSALVGGVLPYPMLSIGLFGFFLGWATFKALREAIAIRVGRT